MTIIHLFCNRCNDFWNRPRVDCTCLCHLVVAKDKVIAEKDAEIERIRHEMDDAMTDPRNDDPEECVP